jgi:hypothetical protein
VEELFMAPFAMNDGATRRGGDAQDLRNHPMTSKLFSYPSNPQGKLKLSLLEKDEKQTNNNNPPSRRVLIELCTIKTVIFAAARAIERNYYYHV